MQEDGARPGNDCDTTSIVAWLADGARSAARAEDVLDQLCARLLACGVPLSRAAVFVRTLHPDVTGRRFLWRPETGTIVGTLSFERLDTDEYLRSPVTHVYATGAPLRRRIADFTQAQDFEVLRTLHADGATDYLASPLPFTDGSIHVASWTTHAGGGFTDAHVAALGAIVASLARVAEIRALRRTATTLLDTYVGRLAGARILSGQIRRGHTETIHAAIWLSDLRDFTGLSERLAPPALIALLDLYFDCQVPAILERGGEVLKFIGDGLLAIFPIVDAGDARAVCERALAAACDARSRVAALAASALPDGVGALRFGLALHVGDVLYGNVGGADRLDFTCIGPAVNLAARIEQLAKPLGRTVVLSSDFAAQASSPRLAPAGEHALPGVAARQAVFGLADEPASAGA